MQLRTVRGSGGNAEASYKGGGCSLGPPSVADSVGSQMLMSLREVKRFVLSVVLK